MGDFFGSFVFYFLIFMLIALISWGISRLRSKSKEKGFRGYLAEHFPQFGPNDPMLMAKSKSKQAKPDMAMAIDDAQDQVIILRNPSGKQIEQFVYPASDMTFLNRGSQMIGRGFAPKTWSYEEHLEIIFKDAIRHYFYLENISNKSGTDSGADVVRQMINPWFMKLSEYYNQEQSEA